MDSFSSDIYNELLKPFPEFEKYGNPNSDHLEIDIYSDKESLIGGLIIQTTENKDIWLRNYHPYSSLVMDNVKELIDILKGVLSDDLVWLTSMKGEAWIETKLVNHYNDLVTEKGITYNVLSWSGLRDNVING